ncbi:MAG: transposase [Planctomycetota bacterium]|jgi:hypothetical protein
MTGTMTAKKRNPRHRCNPRGHWAHVSSRVRDGRYAFVPPDDDGLFVALMWGIIGRAQKRYGVQVAIAVVVSNHLHLLVRSDRPGAVSTFMQYTLSNLARLTNRTYGTSGPVFDGPFRMTTLLDREAEEFWFAYVMAHMTKEGIVPSPNQWIGLQCVDHLLNGTQPRGLWFDFDAWDNKGRPTDRKPFLRAVEVQLTPLACSTTSSPTTPRSSSSASPPPSPSRPPTCPRRSSAAGAPLSRPWAHWPTSC